MKYIPSTNSEQLREKVDCLHLDMSWGTSEETQFVECRELCTSCLIHGMIVVHWLVERSRLWRKWKNYAKSGREKPLTNWSIKINLAFVWRTVLSATVRVKSSKVKSSTVLNTFFLFAPKFQLGFSQRRSACFHSQAKAHCNESKHNGEKSPN